MDNVANKGNKVREKYYSRLLALLFFAKLGGYAGLRALYALSRFYESLPSFEDLSSSDMSYLLSIGEIASIPAGFVGPLGEYIGYRDSICFSQFISALSAFLFVSMKPNAIFFFLMLLRALLGFMLSVSSMMIQSAAVVFLANDAKDNTGKITGILELSWSLSLLIIIPIATTFFQDLGPDSVWIFLGIIMLLPIPFLYMILPKSAEENSEIEMKNLQQNQIQPITSRDNGTNESNPDHAIEDQIPQQEQKQSLSMIQAYMKVLFLPGSPKLFNASHFIYNIGHNMMQASYSYWIVDFYQVSPVELGNYATVLALAELLGVVIATFFADKIGLHKSVYLSTIVFGVLCIVYSFCTRITIELGLGTLFVLFIFGEICFVTRIAFAESLVSHEHLTVYLGIFFQMQFAGRAVGAILGNSLWHLLDGTNIGETMPRNHLVVGFGSFFFSLISFGIVYSMKSNQPKADNASTAPSVSG